MCHSARGTGFHSVLPGFVQVQPGVYGVGSRPHLKPTDRNGQGRTFVLFPSAGEPGDRLEIFMTCLKQLEGSYSGIYLEEDNIFVLQSQKLKAFAQHPQVHFIRVTHTTGHHTDSGLFHQ